ncbi:MAG: S8 family serine peptidase [Lachnospiraceae bacterium]|nr:S8 family serine peptidase [Lachnospiraceae bacterium]
MQFKINFTRRLTRVIKISSSILIIFVVLLLSGFTEFESDNLYSYQWGLKNNGNFLVDKSILKISHNPVYFNKLINDTMFYDDKNALVYLYSSGLAYNSLFAKEGFDINWEEGYKRFKNTSGGRDVVVAIIDTGADINHYELADSIWVNVDEIPGNGIDDDHNGYIDDVNGYNFNKKNNIVLPEVETEVHGTHAAGIIASKHNNSGIRGIAYDEHVKIMPLKVLDANESGYMSAVIEAINYAKANGANICNLSLGAYTYDANIDKAIRDNPEMLFVVSAGNGQEYIGYSLDERDVYPAKLEYDNIITVSNASFDGNRYESANYGSYVDVFAPGTLILSTTPNNGFAYLTGTSMAAPFVSAVCAMIYSKFPYIPITSYKKIIINSSTPVSSLMGINKSYGMVNVSDAIKIASTFGGGR